MTNSNRISVVGGMRTLMLLVGALLLSSASARLPVFGDGRGYNSAGATLGVRATQTAPSVYKMQPDRWSAPIVAQIRANGYSFVRLVTTPAPLMMDNRVALQAALDWLAARVDEANEAGLNVIVDLHPWPSDGIWDQDHIIADPAQRAALSRAQVALARMLATKTGGQVALELLNEPPCIGPDKQPVDWSAIQQKMVHAVRAAAPTLPLVLSSCRGDPNRLKAMDARPYVGDPNIYWTFHYYLPATFVWQEQNGFVGIPFPADAALANSPVAMHAMIPLTKMVTSPGSLADVRNYLLNDRGEASIAADMAAIGAWARHYRVPPGHILMGEFGNSISAKNADIGKLHDDSLRWVTAVRSQAQRQGFAWAFWNATGKNNPDFDVKTGFYNETLLKALGVSR